MASSKFVLALFSIISFIFNIGSFMLGHLVWEKCIQKLPITRSDIMKALKFGLIASAIYTPVTYALYFGAISVIPDDLSRQALILIYTLEIANIFGTFGLLLSYFLCNRQN